MLFLLKRTWIGGLMGTASLALLGLGLLFAAAMYLFGELFVTMTAHFLHDVAAFLVFRWLNRSAGSSAATITA
jgi:hypothetical protein